MAISTYFLGYYLVSSVFLYLVAIWYNYVYMNVFYWKYKDGYVGVCEYPEFFGFVFAKKYVKKMREIISGKKL